MIDGIYNSSKPGYSLCMTPWVRYPHHGTLDLRGVMLSQVSSPWDPGSAGSHAQSGILTMGPWICGESCSVRYPDHGTLDLRGVMLSQVSWPWNPGNHAR